MDPRWRRLHDLAMRQRGHVATRQVEAAGLTRPALRYQVRAALQHYEVTDALPAKLHLTVPRSFRKQAPSDVVLHRADLGPDDVRREGLLAYTTPTRTLLDVLAAGFQVEPLRDAYREAVRRGPVRRGTFESSGARVGAYVEATATAHAVDLNDRLARLVEQG